MKRSQALGKIYDILYQNTDEPENNLEDITHMILDTLEREGMIPPAFLYEFGDGDLQTWTNEWESEDEKN